VTDTGFPLPLGSYLWGGGINFAVFSRHAERIWLELFERAEDESPQHRIELTTLLSPDDIYPLRETRPLDQQGPYTPVFRSSALLATQ
jgi:pullulanase/glycogen debranching enzyme